MLFLASFYWDPNRDLFTIPLIDRPIGWYGLLFAFGFFIGYCVMRTMLTRHIAENSKNTSPAAEAAVLTDRMLWFGVFGTLIGARLGHVFFYDWAAYKQTPWDIIKIWEGGLASHGAAFGIICSLLLFRALIKKRCPSLSFLTILDYAVIPAAFIGGCVRIGNFFNQEILGTATTLPWGVIFGHPIDGSPHIPRHPVQIYEAAFYFLVFAALYALWKKRAFIARPGALWGLFLLLTFTFRFLIEFWKLPQSTLESTTSPLLMGQYLSVPFISLGLWLLFKAPPKPLQRRFP